MTDIVIVGGSLAGLHAASALRRLGHEGAITVVGAEHHLPYDRPPLSKRVLAGLLEPERTALRLPPDLDVEWRLGTRALGLDLNARRVRTDGEPVPYDGLVIATGATPRHLPSAPQEDKRQGVHVLRTLDHSLALRADLEAGPRVAVIGAGFIGLEVAATCRELGLEVSVLEALPVPLARAVGPRWGQRIADLHLAHGVDLRLAVDVEGLEGTDRVEGVRLATGEVVAADVVVVGVGVRPETGWLEGSGVDLDNGVVCDERLRVLEAGRPRSEVVAAGDVARWLQTRYGQSQRVEHWTNAVEQGAAAAAALLQGDDAPPFAPIPYFWSDQYGTKIQVVGDIHEDDDVAVVDGDVDGDRWAVAFGRQGRVVASLGFGRPGKVMAVQRLIEEHAPFPPQL